MGLTVTQIAYAYGGSNPSLPTAQRGSSSVDRALAFQAEGRGFESRLPLKERPENRVSLFYSQSFFGDFGSSKQKTYLYRIVKIKTGDSNEFIILFQ